MSHLKKELDILEDAIKSEIEAQQQYNTMYEMFEDEQTCIMCKQFADDETEHRKKLESYYEKLSGGEKCEIDESTLDFINIPDGFSIDQVDLIKRAIQKEKSGYEYYFGMAKVTKDKYCQNLFLELGKIEQKHERELQSLLR